MERGAIFLGQFIQHIAQSKVERCGNAVKRKMRQARAQAVQWVTGGNGGRRDVGFWGGMLRVGGWANIQVVDVSQDILMRGRGMNKTIKRWKHIMKGIHCASFFLSKLRLEKTKCIKV